MEDKKTVSGDFVSTNDAKKQDVKKSNKKNKKPGFFAKIGAKCKDVFSELKKVSWPTKADLRTYSACVLLFVVVCSVLLAVMDLGVGEIIKVITKSEGGLPELLNGWFNI